MTDPDVIPGQHVPWCDSQIGPDFETNNDEITMTIFVCTGCKPRTTEGEAAGSVGFGARLPRGLDA